MFTIKLNMKNDHQIITRYNEEMIIKVMTMMMMMIVKVVMMTIVLMIPACHRHSFYFLR